MSNIDKQALREAAEKYRTTYAAHLKNPRNYDALDAWDKATSEFMALVNNDELNIIASLIDEIDMETGYREGAFVACNRWHTKFRETEAKLEAAEHTAAVDHEAACSLVEENEEVKRKLAAAEKRVAELREWNAGLAQESCIQQQRIAELQIARDKCFLSGLKTGWAYGIADDTEGYNREISDAQAVIDRSAGIGKGE